MNKTQQAAMARFRAKFEKDYGEGSLQRGDAFTPYEVISTGSLTLDYKLGVGGLVEGRLVEYWGPDGVGKTTLANMAIREAQRKHPDQFAFVVNAEHKYDKPWAAQQGVDLSRLMVFPPNDAEDVADALKDAIRSGLYSIAVVDSIGGMIPKAELEKDAEESAMGKYAGIVTRMVKVAATEARKTNVVVLMLNQVRANLSYGADTMTGGGFALKHSTTMKVKFRRTGTTPFKTKVGDEDVIVGHELSLYIERNGVAPAYRTAIVSLFNQPTSKYGPVGVDQVDETVTMGLATGVIQQDGGWYTVTVTGERFNGKPRLVAGLREQPDVVQAIRPLVLAAVAGEVHEEIDPDAIPDDPSADPLDSVEVVGDVKQTAAAAKKPVKKATKAKKAAPKKAAAFRKGRQDA